MRPFLLSCSPSFKCTLSHVVCFLLCCHSGSWKMLAPYPTLPWTSQSKWDQGQNFLQIWLHFHHWSKAQSLQSCWALVLVERSWINRWKIGFLLPDCRPIRCGIWESHGASPEFHCFSIRWAGGGMLSQQWVSWIPWGSHWVFKSTKKDEAPWTLGLPLLQTPKPCWAYRALKITRTNVKQ